MSFTKPVRRLAAALLWAAAAFCLLALPAAAQSYAVLHSFEAPPVNPSSGLVEGNDGNFYGTTYRGGAIDHGTVFKITPGGAWTTLYSFRYSDQRTDSQSPYSALVQGSDGNFYGTTSFLGTSDNGTVFKITASGNLTTIYSFSGSDGRNPYAALVQGADGNFYGTTYLGGASNRGTVFKITPAGALTTLYSFAIDGGISTAELVQGTDGNFYGTTSFGAGTVFKITPSGALTTLHAFSGGDGGRPSGLVQGTDGNFYGTTYGGGASGLGTVFTITPAGALTTLYSFAGSDGSYPAAPLVQGTDGNFYGTTKSGGGMYGGSGTVFKITPSGTLTTLYAFAGIDGASPTAGLVLGSDGEFYGTTPQGGASDPYSGSGTAFKITPAGVLTTLSSFHKIDAYGPSAGLVQGGDGDFYGTTVHGGTSDKGTVFKITPSGTLTTLHSFAGSDGSYPQAALVEGTDGNFYGTTYSGDADHNGGTIFKITPAGALTTLHSFAGSEGRYPEAALVQGTDGNFYGTTYSGGAGPGTVFKITPAGALTTLHSFAPSDGVGPMAGLVQGTDGDFYGTATYGGTADLGTVFKITPSGILTRLYSFSGSDGAFPYANLVQGGDGNFYGTTFYGGTSDESGGSGTVFKITPAGALTTLHSFDSFAESGGAHPTAGLVQGSDGNLYGTTGSGTIFQITPSGTLTTLHSVGAITDGAEPRGSLVQGTDGAFYGTDYVGGPLGGGIIFRLTPGVGPPPAVTGVSPASGSVSGGTVVTVSGTDFQPGATVSFDGAAATGVTYLSARTIYALAPAHEAGAVTVTVANPDLRAGSQPSAYTYINICSPTPMVTAPSTVGTGSPNRTAFAPIHAGSTYTWTIDNGTITSGQGTSQVTFTAGTAGTPVTLSVVETWASGCVSAPGIATVTVAPAGSAVLFYALPPCRVLDTRNAIGTLGAPSLQPFGTRTFDTAASSCGIPADAIAISANVAVTNVGAQGELVVFPSDILQPNTYAICFRAGVTRANNALVSFSKTGATFSVFNDSAAPVDLIVDVNGFFR